jgi:hypothetical protein
VVIPTTDKNIFTGPAQPQGRRQNFFQQAARALLFLETN